MTTFSEVKHKHDNPVASFKLIIYVRMHKQKAPIKMLSRSKTTNLGL